MREVVTVAPKGRPGSGIHPFVGFDMAIREGNNALPIMGTGRVMNNGILNHVDPETGSTEAGRIDVHENEPLRRQVRGET